MAEITLILINAGGSGTSRPVAGTERVQPVPVTAGAKGSTLSLGEGVNIFMISTGSGGSLTGYPSPTGKPAQGSPSQADQNLPMAQLLQMAQNNPTMMMALLFAALLSSQNPGMFNSLFNTTTQPVATAKPSGASGEPAEPPTAKTTDGPSPQSAPASTGQTGLGTANIQQLVNMARSNPQMMQMVFFMALFNPELMQALQASLSGVQQPTPTNSPAPVATPPTSTTTPTGTPSPVSQPAGVVRSAPQTLESMINRPEFQRYVAQYLSARSKADPKAWTPADIREAIDAWNNSPDAPYTISQTTDASVNSCHTQFKGKTLQQLIGSTTA